MRSRPAPLVFSITAFTRLAAAGCDGRDADQAPARVDTVAIELGVTGFVPIPCDQIPDYMPAGTPALNQPIDISLQGGNLKVTPASGRVGPGSTLQWVSDQLNWTVTFTVGQGQPLPFGEASVSGLADGVPKPPAADASVGEGQCGRFKYSVAGVLPSDPDSVHQVDPNVWWVN